MLVVMLVLAAARLALLVVVVVVAAALLVEGLLVQRLLLDHDYSPSLPVSSAAWLRPTLMSIATWSSASR